MVADVPHVTLHIGRIDSKRADETTKCNAGVGREFLDALREAQGRLWASLNMTLGPGGSKDDRRGVAGGASGTRRPVRQAQDGVMANGMTQ